MKTLAGMLIAATLVFGSGCAKTDWIDRTLVTVDVTGTWSGMTQGGGGTASRELLFELEQQGSTVKGLMRFVGNSGAQPTVRVTSGAIEGTVAGDVFRFKQANSGVEGELTVSGDEMNGRISLVNPARIYLRRVDPSSLPASPPR
jgi:hypothetical protein